jgi:VWFA-related protein
VFRTGVELLTVDVTVLDSDGRQVVDLTPADFTVEVDGDRRTVATADYVKLVDEVALALTPARREKPETPGNEAYFSTNQRNSGGGRSILLLVDQGNIRAGAARAVMRSAVRFVDGLTRDDRVALVAIPGPGALVDFTIEHEKVREGLLTIVGQQQAFKGRFNISLSEAIATVEGSDALLRAQLMARECGNAASASELVRCELEVEQEAGEIVIQQRTETQASLRGMRTVLGSLAALEGPKSVILISEGLVLEGLTTDVDAVAELAADVQASLDVMLLDVPSVDVTQSQRPTTPREDRELQVHGLESLAGVARGTLHRIPASADAAFARINRALAGYYLIGVEAGPSDRDGRRHRIQVRTSRRGLAIKSRRSFLASTSPAATSPAKAIERALRAPLPLTDMPVRIATWTFKEPGTARVRLLVAADVERLVDQSLDYTTGIVIVEKSGRVVVNSIEPRTLTIASGDPGVAVYAGSVTLDPGSYLVRLAVADKEGRIASVERRVEAWQIDPKELTVGDLMVAAMPPGGGPMSPSVEARVEGRLAAMMEVYGQAAEQLNAIEGILEVLPDEAGRALTIIPMRAGTGSSPEVRSLEAEVNTAALPPGRYLARATVRHDGRPRGHIVRPFRVVPAPAAAPGETAGIPSGISSALPPDVSKALTDSLPAFDRRELLDRTVMASVLAAAEQGRPAALKSVFQEARAGRLGPAALGALEAGDQALATFLRGLELFANAQTDKAAQQLQLSMQLSPAFGPARLYLGACLAQGPRFREAAGLLQSVPTGLVPGGAASRLAGETWLRAGDAALAITALERAAAEGAEDARTDRGLGIAYVLNQRPKDGVERLGRYLVGNPSDPAALLAAIYSVYAAHASGGGNASLAADRAQVATWAGAYAAAGGPMQGLVDAWKTYLDQLK